MSNADVAPRVRATSAHRRSVEIDDQDLVQALVNKLGTTLLSFMVDRDASTISRWKGGRPIPAESSRRLRATFQVFQLLEAEESDHTIRAWFMGMNPQLDDLSPAETIRNGALRDVMAAARAFASGG